MWFLCDTKTKRKIKIKIFLCGIPRTIKRCVSEFITQNVANFQSNVREYYSELAPLIQKGILHP
jgi:ribosomal protein S20